MGGLTRRAFLAGIGGGIVACARGPRPPTTSSLRDASLVTGRRDLRFLTWNIFMMPPWTGESPRNRERAAAIGQVLLEQDFDVVCLQKVFDGAAKTVLEDTLASRYPHRFGPANESALLLDSGVWVLSKVPLFGYREIAFEDCGEIECLSRKGAMLLFGACARVPFRLIATHLQGEEGDDYTASNDRVRAKQIEAIRDQLVLPHAEPGAPFVFCGDLNVPRFTRMYHRENPNYRSMLERLGAENGPAERITLEDTRENELALAHSGRRQELDYILVRAAGRSLGIERTLHVFRRSGWDDSAAHRSDLSYRYAVSATITFA